MSKSETNTPQSSKQQKQGTATGQRNAGSKDVPAVVVPPGSIPAEIMPDKAIHPKMGNEK